MSPFKIIIKKHSGLEIVSFFKFKNRIWHHIRRTGVKDVPQFQQGKSRNFLVKQSTNIKCDEINIMNVINNNSFNLLYSLLRNDNMYMKGTLRSQQIGVARSLISADYRKF